MESISNFITGKSSAENRKRHFINEVNNNPKVLKKVLTRNHKNEIKDSFYDNHEMFSDLGPREDGDNIFSGRLLTEDL